MLGYKLSLLLSLVSGELIIYIRFLGSFSHSKSCIWVTMEAAYSSSDGSWSVNGGGGTNSMDLDGSESSRAACRFRRRPFIVTNNNISGSARCGAGALKPLDSQIPSSLCKSKHAPEQGEERRKRVAKFDQSLKDEPTCLTNEMERLTPFSINKQLCGPSMSRQLKPMGISELQHPKSDHAAFADILKKLEADDESKVKLSDFTDLDGERVKVGKYSIPHSLQLTVKNIIDAYGDVSKTAKMNPSAAEPIYIIFCAAVKEMSELQLQEVTEDRLLKWRDAIKDALRINFEVDFAMEHLKRIACSYISLTLCLKLENESLRLFNSGDAAVEFSNKPVCSGGGVVGNSGDKKKNNIESAENLDGKTTTDALLTTTNTAGGVVDSRGNTKAGHVDQGEPRRSTRMKMTPKRCIKCDGNHAAEA